MISIGRLHTDRRCRAALVVLLAACSSESAPLEAPVQSTEAVELQFSVMPESVSSSHAISPTIEVTARFESGAIAAAFSGNVTLALADGPAGSTLAGITTVSASWGVARFPDLRITGVEGAYRLRATASGLRSAEASLLVVESDLRLVFGSCYQWSWNAAFEDICVSSGFTVIGEDGSEWQISSVPGGYMDSDPAWSPDGTRIAFSGYRHCSTGAERCLPEIYVMNADGSSVTALTNLAVSGSSYGPTWSPDGRRIAFELWQDTPQASGGRLYVMNADGTNLSGLGDLSGSSPAWSPDGRLLAFSTIDGAGRWAIHVANADGSQVHRLTNPASAPGDPANDHRPTWAPDGQRIAFTRSWTHPAGNGNCQVMVINVSGGDAVQVTADAFCAHNPAWSPDGTTIAYSGYEGDATSSGRLGIMLVNADGTGATLVRRTNSWPSRVAWWPVR